MRIKQGDLFPFDYILTYDDNKTPIVVTGASITITITKDDATEPTIDEQPCTIINGATGQIRYQWKGIETSTVGMYKIEFHITFADGSKLTVPSADVLWLYIVPSLR